MSSPGSSERHRQAIDDTRTRILKVEKDAIDLTHVLQRRMSLDYVQKRVRFSFKQQVKNFNEEVALNYDHWRVIMLRTLTRNPIPAALVGLGMYWLLKNSSDVKDEWGGPYRHRPARSRDDEFYDSPPMRDQIEDGLQSAKDKVTEHLTEWQGTASNLKDQASQRTQEFKDESQQKLQEMKGYVQEQAHYAKSEINQVLEKNPLALGGIMLAIGAVVAATLPSSRQENQWMGGPKEKMMASVKSKVQSTVEDVKHEAKKLAENVSDQVESSIS
ncbi:MAG: hypothetical protein WD425_07530 [Nitrospirales bacterium]